MVKYIHMHLYARLYTFYYTYINAVELHWQETSMIPADNRSESSYHNLKILWCGWSLKSRTIWRAQIHAKINISTDGNNFKPRIAIEIMIIPEIILYVAHFLLVLGSISESSTATKWSIAWTNKQPDTEPQISQRSEKGKGISWLLAATCFMPIPIAVSPTTNGKCRSWWKEGYHRSFLTIPYLFLRWENVQYEIMVPHRNLLEGLL